MKTIVKWRTAIFGELNPFFLLPFFLIYKEIIQNELDLNIRLQTRFSLSYTLSSKCKIKTVDYLWLSVHVHHYVPAHLRWQSLPKLQSTTQQFTRGHLTSLLLYFCLFLKVFFHRGAASSPLAAGLVAANSHCWPGDGANTISLRMHMGLCQLLPSTCWRETWKRENCRGGGTCSELWEPPVQWGELKASPTALGLSLWLCSVGYVLRAQRPTWFKQGTTELKLKY